MQHATRRLKAKEHATTTPTIDGDLGDIAALPVAHGGVDGDEDNGAGVIGGVGLNDLTAAARRVRRDSIIRQTGGGGGARERASSIVGQTPTSAQVPAASMHAPRTDASAGDANQPEASGAAAELQAPLPPLAVPSE